MKISKKTSTVFSFAIIIAILVLPFIFRSKYPHVNKSMIVTNTIVFDKPLIVGNKAITVAISDTEAKREQGLSGTAPLEPTQGMLFVFDSPLRPAFWMKDMNYPLDIVWINQDKKIVDVSENLNPNTYPMSFSPIVPVMYVLEVPAGFYKINLLRAGDSVVF